ncbi:hypothetical protein F4677DRAFT_402170 [Hypoxylon crocopeplum]|nr:hypothetical protein F4677DRAFT_402170 [Hypoxylon crocopeplum]
MSTQTTFPDLPKSGIKFPNSPIISAAFVYTKEHTTEATYNHCVRSAYWALILAKKLPNFASLLSPASGEQQQQPLLNLETVVLATVLHDMGWAVTKELLSKDKRFEVDGADLARAFVARYAAEGGQGAEKWDDARVKTIWDAIALHTTGSIALHHPAPEVTLAYLGIMADFTGPQFPPGNGAVISEAEYREVAALFPLAGFGVEGIKDIMCGLCRDKPESTYDNVVSGFALAFGVDGKGGGIKEFREAMEKADPMKKLVEGLGYLEDLLKEGA